MRTIFLDLVQENELFLSAASGWEIAIKARLGKLQVPDNLELFMADQLAANDINVLPVQMSHVRKFLSGS
ncbi:hypothetical protein [Biomaibacter acetigenes]|uniref:hypothetical protein n=1 Tax=Biomaibacter acetigenes TaxID=2316383 RepID=UPI001656A8FC|nr:hypothetical protein [Biomaibacter acetigenes]